MSEKHMTQLMYGFDENNPSYRCCCGCCHVKCGAIAIGIVEMILCVYQICVNAWILGANLPDDQSVLAVVCTRLTINTIFFLCILCLFASIAVTNHHLVWPHLIMQVVYIVYSCGHIIVAVLMIIFRNKKEVQDAIYNVNNDGSAEKVASIDDRKRYVIAYASIELVIAVICLFIQSWFIMVIRQLQKYLRDKRYVNTAMGNNAVAYSYGMQPHGYIVY